jgi:hypothetical protein
VANTLPNGCVSALLIKNVNIGVANVSTDNSNVNVDVSKVSTNNSNVNFDAVKISTDKFEINFGVVKVSISLFTFICNQSFIVQAII